MEADKIICGRCGKCCKDVGTMWTGSTHPIIQELYALTPADRLSDSGRCGMLVFAAPGGRAVCYIEKHLGREFKPEVCREYPEAGEKCRRDD